MVYYGLPTVWSDEVEEAIIAAVARRLSGQARSIGRASLTPGSMITGSGGDQATARRPDR